MWNTIWALWSIMRAIWSSLVSDIFLYACSLYVCSRKAIRNGSKTDVLIHSLAGSSDKDGTVELYDQTLRVS